MAAVKSGKGRANGSRRRGAGPRGRGTRWPLVLAVLAVAGVAIVGSGAFGLRSSAVNSITGFADELADAGLRRAGLTVQDVTVSGRRNAPSHEILAALRVDRGVSILTFDTKRARARVLDVDWIEAATVTRHLPDTVHVSVVEREPFAVWKRSGRNYVIDEKGETITEASPQVMARLPYLVGEGAPQAAPFLLAMLEARPSIKAMVVAAVRVGQRRWTLKLNDGIDVKLPAARVAQALDELIRLAGRVDLLNRDIRFVDLRIPDRLTVRTRNDEKTSRIGDTNS